MELWTRKNVSDHCGFHHRRFLLIEISRKSNISIPQYSHSISNMIIYDNQIEQLSQTISSINLNIDNSSPLTTHTNNTNNNSNNNNINYNKETVEECLLLWRKEFAYLEKMIQLYPGHETLWYHRRFLTYYWFVYLSHYHLPSFPQAFSLQTINNNNNNQQQEQYPFELDEEDDVNHPDTQQMNDRQLRWPSLHYELRFYDYCLQDKQVTNYEDQYQLALACKIWTLEMVMHILFRRIIQIVNPLHQ